MLFHEDKLLLVQWVFVLSLIHISTKYAAIVMNPPFSAGAAHLLKARDVMQDGGKIRCLLNAETLRNPCTNERKELAAKLEEMCIRDRSHLVLQCFHAVPGCIVKGSPFRWGELIKENS